MFYFAGDLLLSFSISYNGVVITPDNPAIYIYLGDTIINSGEPVLIGQSYNYVVSILDADILPNYYNSYRFMVTAYSNGIPIVSNGYFIVHVNDYDNLDNAVVYLSNQNSEIIMQCADQTREQCLASPPVAPEILSIDMYRMNSSDCDCLVKK